MSRRPGVTIITNDTSPETGLGRTTYGPWPHIQELADFPVRLAVLDRENNEVRVHEGGQVETKTLLRLPEHRYTFWLRASRHVPKGEINHLTNQVLSYLPVPDKTVLVHDLFFRTEDLSPVYRLHSYWLYPPIRGALHVLANSQATKQQVVDLLDVDPGKITVLPLGVDADRFRCELSPFEARRNLELPADAPILFHLSTETPRKNVDGILRALAALRRREGLEDALLVKAGNATRKQDRKRHQRIVEELDLQDAVWWAGYVDEDELPAYFRAADLLAFPSHREGFGLPVLEAMAAGTPVVTSTTSALPEAAGDAAVLVDPEDPEAIADGIARVLQDRELARRLVQRGQQRVDRFTWEAMAEAMVERFRELLDRVRGE